MAVIRIQVYVADVPGTMRLFDHIEVQRSNEGPPSFADAVSITAPAAVAATLRGTAQQPYVGLNNTSLRLKVNQGSEIIVPFTDPDPTSIQAVIRAISAAVPGIVADDVTNYLRLTTTRKGTGSSIEILDGTANSILGFVASQKDTGEDEHVQLLRRVAVYGYSDQGGNPTSYYRTRFVNKVSSSVSTWSDWAAGTTTFAVDASNITTGEVKLANIDGTPLVGAKITLVNVFSPIMKDSYFIAGRSRTIVTDASGQAQITLVKESTVDVVLEGTGVVRRIKVPTTSPFNLLDPSLQTDDPFGIQTPDLPAAVRSTL